VLDGQPEPPDLPYSQIFQSVTQILPRAVGYHWIYGRGSVFQNCSKLVRQVSVSPKFNGWGEILGIVMILASVISFLFGAILGQRFNVVVLVPATAIAMIVSLAGGAANPQSAWAIIKLALVASVCLQFGYFAGIILQRVIPATPSRPTAPASPVEAPTHRVAR
jgi:hypothetical protein